MINVENKLKEEIIAMEHQGFHFPKPQNATSISEERLEAMLLEGLNSGTPTEMTPKDWEEIRQAVRVRIVKRKEHK